MSTFIVLSAVLIGTPLHPMDICECLDQVLTSMGRIQDEGAEIVCPCVTQLVRRANVLFVPRTSYGIQYGLCVPLDDFDVFQHAKSGWRRNTARSLLTLFVSLPCRVHAREIAEFCVFDRDLMARIELDRRPCDRARPSASFAATLDHFPVYMETVDGVSVAPNCRRCPQLQEVPMGWTWALTLVQAAHESILDRSLLLQAGRPDIHQAPVGMLHVDKVSVTGQNESEVTHHLSEACISTKL